MNIIFFGTGQYAVPTLEALLSSRYHVSLVVTRPDRGKDRSGELMLSPVKRLVRAHVPGVKLCQPEDVNGPTFVRTLRQARPQLIVVVDFGSFLSSEILSLPERYCINLHASLLPRWRGASPVNRAILAGDRTTGNTVIKLTERMDAGPVMLKQELAILPEEDAPTLEKRLAESASGLMLEVLGKIERGEEEFSPQDEEKATYAPKLRRREALVDWTAPCEHILRQIRAFKPWPGTYTFMGSRRIRILKALEVQVKGTGSPGTVSDPSDLTVLCGKGALRIEELQAEGKRPMRAEEFVKGARVSAGDVLG